MIVIVVKSNVLAYLYLPGEYTAAAEELLEQEPEWAAPTPWRSECRNILAGCMRCIGQASKEVSWQPAVNARLARHAHPAYRSRIA